ncbi:MAG: DUF255 domain-containing protein [Planctomycetota bacterium]|nr:DUF255 domain-containing protein [Planctomycetota bacterium]
MHKLTVGCSLLALSVGVSAQDTFTAPATVKIADMTNRQALPPVSPKSDSVTLAQGGPEGADLHAVWSGDWKRAGGATKVAVAKSDAEGELWDRLCVDFDGDGKFGDEEQFILDVSEMDSRGTKVLRSGAVDMSCAGKGGDIAIKASFMKFGDRAPTVSMQFPAYLEARVEIGGTERVIAVVDQDVDGSFGSAGDMWAMGAPGGRPASAYGLSALGERVFQEGKLYGIQVLGDEVRVTTAAATGPDAKDAAAHRERVEHLWMERFDGEREDFIAQRGLDTTRAKAEKSIPWQYVTYEEAIALGKKANKPVFIDVMAFWCVWCYRMDYYTYPDAEVARMLTEDYIPVKVIQEQDLVGDYDRLMKEKLEARGIPAMGVFNGDGAAIHKIGGWKKPEDFIAELKSGLEAFGK